MQSKQDLPISEENDNLSNSFEPHLDKKSALKELKIKADDIDLVGESLDIESYTKNMLSRRIP